MLHRFSFIDSENDKCDNADNCYRVKHKANLTKK